MGLNETVVYTLVGRDQLSKTFQGASKSAKLLSAGVLAVGAGLLKVGSDFDKAYDTIRVGTGATGKSLESLKGDFKAVVKDVPADFTSASKAVADLNTRTGLSGKPLQEMSKQFLNLSRITGEDVSGSVRTVTRVFGDWGIKTGDQSEAMDALFRSSQSTGIGVSELSKKVVQFGAPLRQLGFGFEESAALMGKWEKEGVNAEAVLAGMKIGLANFAEAGEEPAKALERVTKEIKNAGSAGEANKIAIEAFGKRAGPDMAAAVREGRFGIQDLLKVVKGGKETINDAARDTESFGEKWTRIKNQVFVKVEPLASAMFDGIGAGMDGVTETVGNMKAAWDEMPGWVKIGLGSLAGIATTAPIVVGAFNGIKGQIEKMKTAYAQMGRASKIAHGAMGAVGLILGVAATALAVFGTKSAAAKERQEELAVAGKSVAEVIKEQNGAINDAVVKKAAEAAEDAGLLSGLKNLGIEYGTVTDAILGQGSAYDQIKTKLEEQRQKFAEMAGSATGEQRNFYMRQASSVGDLLDGLNGLIGGKNRELEATKRVDKATKDSTETTKANTDAQRDLSKELQGVIDKMAEAAGKVLSARDAQRQYESAVDAAKEALKENGVAVNKSRTAFLRNTEAGRKNEDSLDAMADAAHKQADSMRKNGASHDVTTNKMKKAREEFITVARKMGLSRDAAQKLANKLKLIPGKYKADVVANTSPANRTLNAFFRKWQNKQINFAASTGGLTAAHGVGRTGLAAGGPVFGGVPGRDSVPAMLMPGEHVWTAREVAAAGGHGAMEQFRAMVKAGKIPAFAKGGAITLKATADVSAAQKAMQAQWTAMTSFGGGGSSVQRWAPMVLQALRIMGQSSGLLGTTLRRMNQESGGNPRAVNLWDVNARRGYPSAGLMQVIRPTYQAYKHPRFDVGPYMYGTSVHPLANTLASMRYTLNRYGSLPAGYNRAGGYDNGGKLMPGWTMAYNGTGRPENVQTAAQAEARPLELHIHGNVYTKSSREFEDMVVKAFDSAQIGRRIGRQASLYGRGG